MSFQPTDLPESERKANSLIGCAFSAAWAMNAAKITEQTTARYRILILRFMNRRASEIVQVRNYVRGDMARFCPHKIILKLTHEGFGGCGKTNKPRLARG